MNKTILCTALVTFVKCGFCLGSDATPTPAESDKDRLIDCGAEKVIVIAGTQSPDSAYAIGWTLRPTTKGTPAVDWSSFDPEQVWDFLEKYDWENEKAPYSLLDCVVDLRRKKLVTLPTDNPYHTNKNHGGLAIKWSPDVHGGSYAVVENDARFSTDNLWLVLINREGGIQQADLEPRLSKTVAKVLLDKRPWNHEDYATSFPVSNSGQPDASGAVFREGEVEIPFEADVPKSDVDSVIGSITVHLPEATITKVSCKTRRDDPFNDDHQLAKADRELNQTYTELLKHLDEPARAALRKEQRDWIQERDGDAHDAARQNESDDSDSARNNSLRKSTEARYAELKARLSKLQKRR
jgi:uncharacterized protein YecT (DUF1311 family)